MATVNSLATKWRRLHLLMAAKNKDRLHLKVKASIKGHLPEIRKILHHAKPQETAKAKISP
jgi:hypothetical protein